MWNGFQIPGIRCILRHHQRRKRVLTFPLALFCTSQGNVLVPPGGYVTKPCVCIRCEESQKAFFYKKETLAGRRVRVMMIVGICYVLVCYKLSYGIYQYTHLHTHQSTKHLLALFGGYAPEKIFPGNISKLHNIRHTIIWFPRGYGESLCNCL